MFQWLPYFSISAVVGPLLNNCSKISWRFILWNVLDLLIFNLWWLIDLHRRLLDLADLRPLTTSSPGRPVLCTSTERYHIKLGVIHVRQWVTICMRNEWYSQIASEHLLRKKIYKKFLKPCQRIPVRNTINKIDTMSSIWILKYIYMISFNVNFVLCFIKV